MRVAGLSDTPLFFDADGRVDRAFPVTSKVQFSHLPFTVWLDRIPPTLIELETWRAFE